MTNPPHHMTKDEFKAIRSRLELSQYELAGLVGLQGDHRARTVRRYEQGELAVPGTWALLLRMWEKHGVPKKWLKAVTSPPPSSD